MLAVPACDGESVEPEDERTAQAHVEGSLDKDQIRDVVRSEISDIRSCYNAELAEDPELAGRIAVQFVIAPDGRVSNSEIAESDVPDSMGDCIVDAVASWQFPEPAGNGSVIVTYPFNLEPG